MRRFRILGAVVTLVLLLPQPARAQLAGSHNPGDFGVQSGSQPQPGLYTALFYYRYQTDTIKDADGEIVRPSPGEPSSIDIKAFAPILWYVSKAKFMGANVGALVVLPWANGTIEAPAFSVNDSTGTRYADMVVRPLDLGWHGKRADATAGFQLYAPTGRWAFRGSDNVGRGMWTFEPFLGTTLFFDEKRTVSLATTAYWEFHGEKKDTTIKPGQVLTLQGGLGKSFLGGGVVVGAAYYAQWKVTEDRLAEFVLPGGEELEPTLRSKHRVYAFGPDVTLPVASNSKLFALVNVRYFWETGAQVRTEGQTLTVTATFPVPSVKLR